MGYLPEKHEKFYILKIVLIYQKDNIMKKHYLNKILKISEPYLKKAFSEGRLEEFLEKIKFIMILKIEMK